MSKVPGSGERSDEISRLEQEVTNRIDSKPILSVRCYLMSFHIHPKQYDTLVDFTIVFERDEHVLNCVS